VELKYQSKIRVFFIFHLQTSSLTISFKECVSVVRRLLHPYPFTLRQRTWYNPRVMTDSWLSINIWKICKTKSHRLGLSWGASKIISIKFTGNDGRANV